ncbi:MAG: MotA/TolQ/ExbB proton channel family protein [Sedimentisphaerales bacterium]|nr:MotA/TolQ/ExbB proton channel family protein [Sedimentisphaerales bacterium]
MNKSLLIKTLALTTGLAGVAAAMYFVARGLAGGSDRSGELPTFLEQFVIAGGPIVWFVLLPMSLITVYLATLYFLTIRRSKLLPDGTVSGITGAIRQFGLGRLEARLAGRSDLVGVAVAKAVGAGRGDWFRIRNILAESLQDRASGLLRRIEWLNLIGNVSPMVGLFGTVYGMIKLFNTIVLAGGEPQTVQLADGISIALVTTFWGLFIAIPALAVHGVFQNRIEALVNDAVMEAESIMPEIRRGLERQKLALARRADKASQAVRGLASVTASATSEVVPSR